MSSRLHLTLSSLRLRSALALAGPLALALALSLSPPAAAQGRYGQTNLVSDIPGLAITTDPNLKNAWGISNGPGSPFWISDNGTGLATLYDGAGTPRPLVVTIPPPSGGSPPSAPTGQVFANIANNFFLGNNVDPAIFIFATEDGTIAGWNPGEGLTNAVRKVDNSAAGAVYKGLALGSSGGSNFLYAANFTQGKIDVFDSTFSPATLGGSFTDPNLPAGYAPFNVQNIGGSLYVTYAKQQGGGSKDDAPGAGHGLIDVYDTSGNLLHRLATGSDAGGTLSQINSPWGLALAPSDFGAFSNDLLVGNFGDGRINAFDPSNGNFLGQLNTPGDKPVTIDGLWALTFGNGAAATQPNTLYFTSGPNDEANGLYGSLQATVPEPGTVALLGLGLLPVLAAARRRRR